MNVHATVSIAVPFAASAPWTGAQTARHGRNPAGAGR